MIDIMLSQYTLVGPLLLKTNSYNMEVIPLVLLSLDTAVSDLASVDIMETV